MNIKDDFFNCRDTKSGTITNWADTCSGNLHEFLVSNFDVRTCASNFLQPPVTPSQRVCLWLGMDYEVAVHKIWCWFSCTQAVLQMPVEVQSELCRQNLVPSFPQSRRSVVAEHPLILLEQLLMNEKVCVFIIVINTNVCCFWSWQSFPLVLICRLIQDFNSTQLEFILKC